MKNEYYQNENEYYGSPANPGCHDENWWDDINEPDLKCRDSFLSAFVPDAWVVGEKRPSINVQ